MFKKVACGLVLALSLSYGAAYAENEPTLDQVYKAAQSGQLDEAQKMMGTVLSAHPNSAKAHFIEAELLVKQGQLSRAESELATAERLKPGLPFANAQSVQDLKSRISSSHRISQPSAGNYQTQPENSFPWGMLLLGIAACTVIFLIMRAKTARNQPVYQGNYPQTAGAMGPYGGGMGPAGGGMGQSGMGQGGMGQGGMGQGGMAPGGFAPMGGGMGGGGMASGIMGGLATGAAVGVGVVAGEALAHQFMGGGHNAAPQTESLNSNNLSPNNMGGNDFGIADTGSWDDSSNIASSNDGGSDWS
jgi:hypothetical protein